MILDKLKVAIVHDWLTYPGGAEKCLECFCEIFPQADIFTLLSDKSNICDNITSHNINTSFLQKIPWASQAHRYFLPLIPLAIEQFNFNGYDLVISSSHAAAKGIITPTNCTHISYIYTPMRYAWFMTDTYFGNNSGFSPLFRPFINLILHYLRIWDKASIYRVDNLIAISEFVKNRIAKVYRRESEVIYPPVDVYKFKKAAKTKKATQSSITHKIKEDFFVTATNYEPNKNTELLIKAFCEIDEKLKIVGSFQRRGRKLQDKYKDCKNIEFCGYIADSELTKLFVRAKGFITAGLEDFGMALLEANSAGTGVIAYKAGGHLETVVDASNADKSRNSKSTGIFFSALTKSAIIESIKKYHKFYKKGYFDSANLQNHAQKFSKKRFKKDIKEYIQNTLSKTKT
jgi:glycosyltransferase involved in cell wall biosynthesis